MVLVKNLTKINFDKLNRPFEIIKYLINNPVYIHANILERIKIG